MAGNTGQRPEAGDQTVEGGQDPAQDTPQSGQSQAQAAPPSNPEPPQAGVDDANALRQQLQESRTALQEQRRVQAGLDRTVSELREQNEELQAEVERLNEIAFSGDEVKSKYEEQMADLRQKSEAEVGELQAQLSGTQQEIEALRAENERLQIIAGEFPHLAALLEAGAVPQADSVDEFRAKLQALSETFVPADQAQEFARQRGSRPPASPPTQQAVSQDDLAADMRQALKDGDKERYAELREKWYEQVSME